MIPIPSNIQRQMFNVLRDVRIEPFAATQFLIQLGHVHSAAIKSFCQRLNINDGFIDFVGSHSEAIGLIARSESQIPSPGSLGAAIVIAAQTALSTVTEFKFVGQPQAEDGPRASINDRFDNLLLRHEDRLRVCLNLGSTTAFSLVPPTQEPETHPIIYGDCVCGTRLIDIAMRAFSIGGTSTDANGVFGVQGMVNQVIVDRFLEEAQDAKPAAPATLHDGSHHDALARKIMDDCMFMALPDHDTIATITRISAEAILQEYRKFVSAHIPDGRVIDEIIICGRGARNSNIVSHIRNALPDTTVMPLEALGVPSHAKDAVSCAYLGLDSALHIHTNDEDIFHAKVAPGPGWKSTTREMARFSQGQALPAVTRLVVDKNS